MRLDAVVNMRTGFAEKKEDAGAHQKRVRTTSPADGSARYLN